MPNSLKTDESRDSSPESVLPPDIRLKMDEYVDDVIKARVERIESWIVKFGKWVAAFSAFGIIALIYSGYRETIRLAEGAAKDTATITARNTTIADLSEKISERGEFIRAVAESAAFPEGTVISFLPKMVRGKLDPGSECPKGWAVLSEATGRFIVGAGRRRPEKTSTDKYANWFMGKEEPTNRKPLREYELLSIGGEEQHLITPEEMPKHSHAVYPHAGLILGRVGQHRGAGSEDPNETSKTNGRTEEIGGSQPHNNLPPFIALYFCIKQSPQAIPSAERTPSKR